jgi:hypothetical protein
MMRPDGASSSLEGGRDEEPTDVARFLQYREIGRDSLRKFAHSKSSGKREREEGQTVLLMLGRDDLPL